MAEAPKRVLVHSPQGLSGYLLRDGGGYLFSNDPQGHAEVAPALSMPFRPRPYEHPTLHPIFQMNLPEGYVLEQLRQRLAKTSGLDPLLLLSIIGAQAPIGRLRYQLEGAPPPSQPQPGERLADLLASKGSRELFSRLVDSYLLRSGLSGVQPKVLVPEASHAWTSVETKAAMTTQELIVKSGLGEFPGLAINEFVCMSIVRQAGVSVPEFYLSQDHELFIMRRFDRPASGQILGFEDMLVLAGRDAELKYKGSYELILRLLRHYVSPEHLPAARQQLFDMVALSCILGNGDAHMKNFGVLYASVSGAVQMAPAYDIVCTRLYLPDDNLALDLAGNRSFFAARLGLLDFGVSCDLPRAQVIRRVMELARLTLDALPPLQPLLAQLPGLAELLQKEAQLYWESFSRLK